MERYIIHEESALSVASLAMQTMIHIKSKISTEPFHTTKPKHNGNYKKSFQELFRGTRYENVLEMMLGVLNIFNQYVNEKSKENKMIKETNTAEVYITVSANIENNEKKHSQAKPTSVVHSLKDKVRSIVCHGILKRDTEEQPKKSEKQALVEYSHKNSQVSEETKEPNVKKHNVDGEQHNDIKIEDETSGETHVPKNQDESIHNQKLASKDSEVESDCNSDGQKEYHAEKNDINHAANNDTLLATVRSKNENHVCECFGLDCKSFISDMDKVQLSNETHVSILQQIVAKYEKWKRDDFLVSLPDYVLVPIQAIQNVFETQLKNKTVLLKVTEIEGNGNCLYRSLSESKVVKECFPKFKSYKATEPCQYVREVMYGFAKANQNLSFMIWKHYVPKKGDVNSRINTENYESWVETLQRNYFWGGPAEYTLFAYVFKCHVVCLRQLNSQVEIFCTREFHRKISNDIDRKRFIQMAEMLRSPSDVIFIWHHMMAKPRHKLGNEEIGYGDHYSFLEYDEKKKKKLFYDTFTFQ
jgi:hypothetical protein